MLLKASVQGIKIIADNFQHTKLERCELFEKALPSCMLYHCIKIHLFMKSLKYIVNVYSLENFDKNAKFPLNYGSFRITTQSLSFFRKRTRKSIPNSWPLMTSLYFALKYHMAISNKLL